MNKKDNIEEFLRDNRPVVKDDPTFLLETNRRLKSVEGIKAEVDRQRVQGHMALIVTLVIGIVIGAFAVLIGYMHPFDLNQMKEGSLYNALVFIETWKQYLIIPVALLSVTLSLVLSLRRNKAF
jgi:hypothetical protein